MSRLSEPLLALHALSPSRWGSRAIAPAAWVPEGDAALAALEPKEGET